MKALRWILLLMAYAAVVVPLSGYLRERPVEVKLGYVPDAQVVRPLVGDQRLVVAEYAVAKVLFYFGTLVDQMKRQVVIPPEYYNMFKTLETAVKLDPYNMDAYYFAQAAFTWEVGRAADVNQMLEYGMKYRDWDYLLPFFAGFNAAYFLKDYQTAADYMRKAAEISGHPLLTSLASRYLFESGRNELAIKFLDTMVDQTEDSRERKLYRLRREALVAVSALEKAVEEFRSKFFRAPEKLSELVEFGLLEAIPEDPYGGTFYLDQEGRVRTTSRFATGSEQ